MSSSTFRDLPFAITVTMAFTPLGQNTDTAIYELPLQLLAPDYPTTGCTSISHQLVIYPLFRAILHCSDLRNTSMYATGTHLGGVIFSITAL